MCHSFCRPAAGLVGVSSVQLLMHLDHDVQQRYLKDIHG